MPPPETECGEVDPYLLAPLINPAFTGAPAWPNLRQAYKTVRGPAGIILATDGLSDPFDDSWRDPPKQNGFAVEVFGVTEVEQPLKESWIFQVVAGFAAQVAGHGQIHARASSTAKVGSASWWVWRRRRCPVRCKGHCRRFVSPA